MPETPEPARDADEPPAAHPRTLYVVATSHLDTQWRWTVRDTIRTFLPRTLAGCFAALERFPSFVLSFEGAFRYRLIREHYPREYARLKEWVRAGRWHPAGAMLDAADVNIPSPESLIRHVLYGNRWFERELGVRSRDIFLPDCFGFGAALPSVASQCGLAGFSSQKFIKWMSPAAIPFELGLWEGPDGAAVVAVLDPDAYGDPIDEDLARSARWQERIDRLGKRCGVWLGYKYFGPRGDRGGAPDDGSLARLEEAAASAASLRVVPAASDRLFLDLSAEDRSRLPRHRGDLLLPTHGTGCLTSLAALKRWNRKNEQLAAAAERAACAAAWLGAAPYPAARLEEAWLRFLWHQMHDDITGTSIPAAYELSFQDQAVAANLFAEVLAESAGAVARGLDTRPRGGADALPLVVFNALGADRVDIVEASLAFPGGTPAAVRVFGPEGDEVPAQVTSPRDGGADGGEAHIVFLASVPAVGFAVYEVRRERERAARPAGPLLASPAGLESSALQVAFGPSGDPCSIVERGGEREILSAPLALALLPDRSRRWPAWEIRWEDVQAAPLEILGGPARVRVVETGPARVAVEVERTAAGSVVRQCWRLSAGDGGGRLEAATEIDWRTRQRLLKATFPLAVANAEATYDLGLGAIRRGINRRELYERPAQQWADLGAADRGWGVSILSDSRCGWDQPDERTLRLTLVRSPGARRSFRHQATQDFGRHRLLYALFPHTGDWGPAGTAAQAARLNQPLRAFAAPPHSGVLGRSFSFLRVERPAVELAALKRAEGGDELIVRLRETAGRASRGVRVALPAPLVAAREVNAAEEPLIDGLPTEGLLALDLAPFAQRTVAVRLGTPSRSLPAPASQALSLPFDCAAASFHGERRGPDFDGAGRSYPGELLPAELDCAGVRLALGPLAPGARNAVACRGQRIALAAGHWERICLLASAVGGGAHGRFLLGAGGEASAEIELEVLDWGCALARPDRWHGRSLGRLRPRLAPGFTRPAAIAWVGMHRHDRRLRDEPYASCFLFRLRLELPAAGASWLELPREPRMRLFAASLARDVNDALEFAGQRFE